MAATGAKRQKEWATGTLGSTINQKSALSAAYAELGKELTSGKLKSVGSYTLGKLIGEGTYGKVRLGTHRLTSTKVAIKQVPKAHSASLTREIHHHRRLHHPNVMQLYEVLATESYIWMVTELCPGGELYDYLVERGTMPEPEARRIFGQLCLAVAYIHDRGIVHRDLKLENVLLDERCNVKLGDFGFTREFEGKRLMETFCGTTGYAAPEMLAGRKYTGEEVDVWSLGVILYALLCGALPFDDDDDNVMKEKILRGEYQLPEVLSDESRDLVASILQQDPSARPTIKDILNHAWFSKVMITTPMATVEEHDTPNNDGYFPGEDEGGEVQPEAQGKAVAYSAPDSLAVPQDSLQDSASGDLAHRGSSSGFSETSFYSARSKSDSESSDRQSSKTETTNPTTEEDEGESEVREETTLPLLFSNERRGTLALHRNESQTTIRREGSSGSDASRKASGAASTSLKPTSSPLPTHHEAPSSPEQSQGSSGGSVPSLAHQVGSAPLEKRNSQSSSRGQHHRTPSRTKRRSSGGLSEHFPPILDFRPTDYVGLLEQSTPAIFSTVIEQNILHQLSSLGMDVGQVVHSVVNEACDASGAMWWILKKKAEERQREADLTTYSPMMASNIGLAPAPPPPPPLPPKDPSRVEKGLSHTPLVSSSGAKTFIKPAAVYPFSPTANHPLGQARHPAVEVQEAQLLPVTPTTTTPVGDTTSASKLTKPSGRHRTSSLSVRLSSVLAGKEKETRREGTPESVTIGDEQLIFAERSKSPVSSLFTKMSGSPTATPAKGEKERKKDSSKSPLRSEAARLRDSEDLGSERVSSSSRSSPHKLSEEQAGRLGQSKSVETFSTISSSTHGDGSPVKSKARPSFLSTVRTWFEDKDKAAGARKQKKQQQQQRGSKLPANAPSHAGQGVASSATLKGPSGSLRRSPYSPSVNGGSSRRSPRQTINHRGSSLSRRSSSGSGQYPPLSLVSPRPLTTRRQSAGSITPTATVNGADDHHSYAPQYHRGSRPSSAQSLQKPVSGNSLHGKSGSTSSSNSILRNQQQNGYNGSLRGFHSRRSSVDGGTTVRRHRNYPNSHHQARSESSSVSRPSTPSKLGAHEEGVDLSTPRRSLDSNQGRSSPLHTPRASQSVFVAHKSRTPYRPPSASASLHRHDRESHDDRGESGSRHHLGTWRLSWGKPPPSWVGPVDQRPNGTSEARRVEKPKLRDVFASKQPEDDWEDEEEEPLYAGGLGQLDSIAAQSWESQTRGQKGHRDKERHDGMPGHLFGSSRYAGVRSIFQPPSLGRETTPKAWTIDGDDAAAGEDGLGKEAPTSNKESGTSRVRAAAPAFKGGDILEEDEEEE